MKGFIFSPGKMSWSEDYITSASGPIFITLLLRRPSNFPMMWLLCEHALMEVLKK